MWLMTKHGFYSVVRHGDVYSVRARWRQDLENLKARVGAAAERWQILTTRKSDYTYRVYIDGADLMLVMAQLSQDVDYPNFKNEVAQHRDQDSKPYHEVWDVMRKAAERSHR